MAWRTLGFFIVKKITPNYYTIGNPVQDDSLPIIIVVSVGTAREGNYCGVCELVPFNTSAKCR